MNSAYTPNKTTRLPNRIQKDLKVHQQLTLSAYKQKFGGAIRLFYVAKSMNTHGWVERKSLKAECDLLGVPKSSFYNWLYDAEKVGLFHYVYSGKKHILKVATPKEAYKIFDVQYRDKHTAMMPAKLLFCEGWIANVWAASNKANWQDRPISQEQKQKHTGVPVSTQRRWDKQARIRRTRNVAISNYDATTANVEAFKEHSNKKGIFVMQGKIAWHLPSQSRTTKTSIKINGSTRSLREVGIPIVPDAVMQSPRLFCHNETEVRVSLRKKEKLGASNDGIYTSYGHVWLFEAIAQ